MVGRLKGFEEIIRNLYVTILNILGIIPESEQVVSLQVSANGYANKGVCEVVSVLHDTFDAHRGPREAVLTCNTILFCSVIGLMFGVCGCANVATYFLPGDLVIWATSGSA